MKTLSTLLGMALVLGSGAGQVLAATWVVNTSGDSVDVTLGDGVCFDMSGVCSLRAALMEANATPTVSDTIVLNVPLAALSIPWQPFSIDDDSSGDLDILGPVTILGGGATVEWASAVPPLARDRVFHFFPPGQAFDAQITDLTVRGGVATAVEVVPLQFRSVGGGVLIQGRDTVRVAVQLDNVKVVENTAAEQGGGLWSQGYLNMHDSTVNSNRVQASGCGGPVFGGGGLYNLGDAHVVRSTFSGNFALYEYADEGGCGGGILNEDGAALTMVNSTVSSNFAFVAGGGIWNRGQAFLSFVTNSFNLAESGAGGLDNQSTVQVTASIVALNAPADCATASGITGGFNLDGDSTCNLTGPGDLSGVDPLLGALQLNPPGLTQTHALLPGSPALDVVMPPCLDVLGDPVLEDQLGNPRPAPSAAARCDIGAVEGISDLLFRDGFESAASRMRR